MARSGYHLVDSSPWPVGVSLASLGLTSSLIGFFYDGFSTQVVFFMLGSVFLLVLCLFGWWKDMVKESTYLGCYSSLVIRNLRVSMALFILSEVFFFVSFFWAFFYFSIGESSMLNVGFWPPVGVKIIYPYNVPVLGTCLLVASGAFVTWAHKSVKCHSTFYNFGKSDGVKSVPNYLSVNFSGGSDGKMKSNSDYWFLWSYYNGLISLGITIFLGASFTFLQWWEYHMASFTISDGVFGSCFFMMTGFHGMHVIVGSIFLFVCFFRLLLHNFSFKSFTFGLDAAVWYWHFVDIVWLFLYGFVYYWGR